MLVPARKWCACLSRGGRNQPTSKSYNAESGCSQSHGADSTPDAQVEMRESYLSNGVPKTDSRRPLYCRDVLLRDKIDLFLDVFLGPSAALQNAHAVLDHLRMTAKIHGSVLRAQSPQIGVFANQVVDAADFPGPVSIFPWAAHRRNVFKPSDFV